MSSARFMPLNESQCSFWKEYVRHEKRARSAFAIHKSSASPKLARGHGPHSYRLTNLSPTSLLETDELLLNDSLEDGAGQRLNPLRGRCVRQSPIAHQTDPMNPVVPQKKSKSGFGHPPLGGGVSGSELKRQMNLPSSSFSSGSEQGLSRSTSGSGIAAVRSRRKGEASHSSPAKSAAFQQPLALLSRSNSSACSSKLSYGGAREKNDKPPPTKNNSCRGGMTTGGDSSGYNRNMASNSSPSYSVTSSHRDAIDTHQRLAHLESAFHNYKEETSGLKSQVSEVKQLLLDVLK